MKIRYKILFGVLILSIGSLSLLSIFIYQKAKRALQGEVFSHLESVAQNKSGELLKHFQNIQKGAFLINKTSLVKNAFQTFDEEFNKLSKTIHLDRDGLEERRRVIAEHYFEIFKKKYGDTITDRESLYDLLPANSEALFIQYQRINRSFGLSAETKAYASSLSLFDSEIKDFIDNLPFSKLSFINKNGLIIYAQGNQNELGASVYDKAFEASGISSKFDIIKQSSSDTSFYFDFSPYIFKYNAETPFLILPVLEKKKFKGAILFEISSDEINRIVNFDFRWHSCGLGQSGAAYIIDTNFRMLSDARFFLEDKNRFITDLRKNEYPEHDIRETIRQNSTIGNIRIVNEVTKAVSKSQYVSLLYKDYLGYEVLGVAQQIPVLGLNWSFVMRIRTQEAFAELEVIKTNILWATLLTFLVSILFAFFMSFRITKPLSLLTANAYELSKGNFNTPISVKGKDELFELAAGFKTMQSQILKLITELRESNDNLDNKQREIFESIRYASRIQENILASPEFLSERLPEHFVYFNPKEIVSGDFYWACEVQDSKKPSEKNYFYLAACDSTGHGIPGAFMSLLNVNYLNQAIIEMGKRETGEILDCVKSALSGVFESHGNKDGMDGILIRMEKNHPVIQFSAANNKPVLIRNKEVICLEHDKMGVGKGLKSEAFKSYTLEVKPNDVLYLISDGFPDQFGGPKNKKYMYKRFYDFLLSIHHLSASQQHAMLKTEFESWSNGVEQTDDVLVIGIKF